MPAAKKLILGFTTAILAASAIMWISSYKWSTRIRRSFDGRLVNDLVQQPKYDVEWNNGALRLQSINLVFKKTQRELSQELPSTMQTDSGEILDVNSGLRFGELENPPIPKGRWEVEHAKPSVMEDELDDFSRCLGMCVWTNDAANSTAAWHDSRSGIQLPGWIPSVPLVVLAAFWVLRIARRRLRPGPTRCPECGYDTRATSGFCTECGTEFTPLERS